MKLKNGFSRWLVIGIILFLLAVAGLGDGVLCAATTPADPPDSGAALDSVKPPETPPSGELPAEIAIPEPVTTPPSGNEQKFTVNGFRLSGETVVPETQLQELLADQAGRELSLKDLYGLTAKITKYLRQNGYPVASAYLPAQRVKDGIVEITVVPGKYGATTIQNLSRIKTKQLQKLLAILKPGTVITRKSLERAVLLLNDLAGVQAKVTLTPGQTPGTTDLIFDVADSAQIGGGAYADNWGSRYTGQIRGGAQFGLNNPAGIGDALHLSGLTAGSGITNGSCDYALPLWDTGLKLELKYSHVNYALGADFAALDASGTADVYGAGLSYPLIRSRVFNLYGSAGFDGKQLKDVVNSTGDDKPRTSSLWKIGLSGNEADNRGSSSFALTYSGGYLSINDAAAAAADALNANTAGNYHKLELSGGRRQIFGPNLNLNLMISGQLADRNLDSSEKFYLGGADGVRAYPQGEGSGDEGYRLTAELQWRIPQWSTLQREFSLAFFSDYGFVTFNKNLFVSGVNTRSLLDAGLGVIWSPGAGFNIRCDYAWKIGSEAATSDTDQAGRLWIRVVKSF